MSNERKGSKMKFENLFNRALKDWPEEIDLGELLYMGEEDLYKAEGLGFWTDNVSDQYIGKSDEVIMRNLQDSIYIALHAAAKSCQKIKTSDLRPQFVKERLEGRLKDALEMEICGWNEKDKELIQAYFSEN